MTAHRLSRPDGCLSAGSRGGRTADLAEAECSTSAYGIRPAGDRQFLKQRSHVGLDRIQGQDEIRRDLLIGTKIRQQLEYIGLARGQRNEEGAVRRSVIPPILNGGRGWLWNSGKEA